MITILEETKRYQGFKLKGSGNIPDDGNVTYTVFANKLTVANDKDFSYSVTTTEDVIKSSATDHGFNGNKQEAMKKIKEIAFENVILKINNKDLTNGNFIYKIIEGNANKREN